MTGKHFFHVFFKRKGFALVTCKQAKNWVGNSRVLVKHIQAQKFSCQNSWLFICLWFLKQFRHVLFHAKHCLCITIAALCAPFLHSFCQEKKLFFEDQLVKVHATSPELHLHKKIPFYKTWSVTTLALCVPPRKSATKLLLMPVEAVSVFIWKVFYISKNRKENCSPTIGN